MHNPLDNTRTDVFVIGPREEREAAAQSIARALGAAGEVEHDELHGLGLGCWVPAVFMAPVSQEDRVVARVVRREAVPTKVYPFPWMESVESQHPNVCALSLRRTLPQTVYTSSQSVVFLHALLPSDLLQVGAQSWVHESLTLMGWVNRLGSVAARTRPYGQPALPTGPTEQDKPLWENAWSSEEQRAPCLLTLFERLERRQELRGWSRAVQLSEKLPALPSSLHPGAPRL